MTGLDHLWPCCGHAGWALPPSKGKGEKKARESGKVRRIEKRYRERGDTKERKGEKGRRALLY